MNVSRVLFRVDLLSDVETPKLVSISVSIYMFNSGGDSVKLIIWLGDPMGVESERGSFVLSGRESELEWLVVKESENG